MEILVSLLGMVVLLAAGVLLSRRRRAIRLRTVVGAFALQVGIGAFVLWVEEGKEFLLWLTAGVEAVIAAGRQGIVFVFGSSLTDQSGSLGFIFAFQVLPVIIFFSSLIAVLYYLGVMKWVVTLLGGAVQKLLGTSRAESLSAKLETMLEGAFERFQTFSKKEQVSARTAALALGIKEVAQVKQVRGLFP